MKSIASIRHNNPEIEERIRLSIQKEPDGRYSILSTNGEDAGQGKWPSEAEALAAIAYLWSAEEWDLQWEI